MVAPLSAVPGRGCEPSSVAAPAAVAAISSSLEVQFLDRWHMRQPDVVLSQEEPLLAAARVSAAELGEQGVLSHWSQGTSSSLERYRRCGGTGRRIGEVVGVGPSFDKIWQAWEVSVPHAAVIDADGWRRFGVAAVGLPRDLVLVVLLLGNSMLDGLHTERGWAHVTVRARLAPAGRVVRDWSVSTADPPLLLRWNGRHLSLPHPVVSVGWDPAPPQVRVQVPFNGTPAWLLLGVDEPGIARHAGARYSDRVLIGVPSE